eukprot:5026089-Prymnesium_polylepis.2
MHSAVISPRHHHSSTPPLIHSSTHPCYWAHAATPLTLVHHSAFPPTHTVPSPTLASGCARVQRGHVGRRAATPSESGPRSTVDGRRRRGVRHRGQRERDDAGADAGCRAHARCRTAA